MIILLIIILLLIILLLIILLIIILLIIILLIINKTTGLRIALDSRRLLHLQDVQGGGVAGLLAFED